QQLRRGGRRPAPRPGGRRPGAVRDHPHRQHRRPDHREPDQQGKDGGLTVSAVPAAALPQPRKVRRSVREVVERPLMIAAVVGVAKHAIIGTIEQVGLATILATPLGLMTAVHLTESRGRLARVTRVLVDAMSGIPSIVAGLYIYTMWVVRFHEGFSGLAAAMALSVLMLPTVARTAEEVIKLVPNGLRESSLALGAPEWKTTLRIILPAARSG